MKRKLSYAVLAALGAFALVVLSGVPLPYAAHAQASPSVAVSLSSDTVEEGAAIAVTMSFSGLESDSDTATRDYVFRADVVGADECEDQAGGYGLGVDRSMYQVDEDPEVRTGSVSADCPAGDYTVQASISSPDSVELASARASFTVTAPAPEPTPEPTPDQEDPDPSVALILSPAGFAPWNTEISVTMLFGGLKADSDRDTTDYIFRADVVDADACEGDGLGIDRYMYQVDEDPETRSGTIAAGCPIGDYTIEASIATEADGVVASTSAEFSIFGPSIGLAIPVTEQGAGGVLTLIFGSLAPDADADTTDYIFRADVVDADACEGDGLGVDRHIHQVDEDPETHTGTISAGCPAGDYTLEASISSPDGVELASASASFTIAPPVEEDDDPPDSAQQQATPVDITLDSQNANPRGVWSNGTTVWVVDSQRHKLYAYTLSSGARDSGKDITLDGANRNATGVWSDGTTIWVADDSDEKLYAYTLSGGARDSGKEFGLASKPSDGTFAADDNGNPAGVWSDGTTIWVADATDDKLYAYTLSNGTRDNAKEFSARPGSQPLGGIWSDGTAMWVVYPALGQAIAYTISGGSRNVDLDLSLRISSNNWGAWSDGTTMWVGNTGSGNRKLFHHELPGTSTDAALQAKVLVTGTVYEPQGGVIVAVRVRTDSYEKPQGSLTLTVQSLSDSAKPGTDYLPFTGTVTFGPDDFFGYYDSGFFEAIKYVARFTIVDDNTPEGDEQLIISVSMAASSASTATTQGAIVTIEDGDELRPPTGNRQPSVTYAIYDAADDAVVLKWAAGSDTQGLTGYRIERSAPGGATELTHADLRGDDRPAVASDVLTWNDTTVPASSLVLYRVWAVFSDGSEVASYAFPATMDRGIVRARATLEGSNGTTYRVSWTDAAYPLGDGSLHYGVCPEGYKVYWQVNIGGNIRWQEITPADEDPAARTFAVIGTPTTVSAGGTIPFRIGCGGSSETTGLLIGEDTATVQ